MPDEVIGVRAELSLQGWSRNVRKLERDADKIDDSMRDATRSVNDFEDELNKIKGDATVDVKANVDSNEVDTLRRQIDGLQSEIVSIKANADDSELQGISDKLDAIHSLAVIDVILNVADTDLGSVPLVGGLVELNTAMAELEGATGRLIPQAEELILDLYTNGWGESRSQIAGVIGDASRLGVGLDDIDEAVKQAFYVSAIPGVGETTEVLRTMDGMVRNELAGSFTEAADILVTGFQGGADRGKDLMDSFDEYGSKFREFGLTGQEALSLMITGAEAGIQNSDRVAEVLNELKVRLDEMDVNPEFMANFERLDELATNIQLADLWEGFNAGEVSGGEFLDGFFGALDAVNTTHPAEAQRIASTLVGTMADDFGAGVVSQFDPIVEGMFDNMEGRAETAGNTISNNLGTAFTTLGRTIEQELVDTVEEMIDVDQIVTDAKDAAATLAAELRAGSSLAEALEITFNLEGFATSVSLLESIMGNFVLTLSEIAAAFARMRGDEGAAAGIQRLALPMAEQQLVFDLQVANSDEFSDIINTAFNRGVDPGDMSTLIRQSIDEAVSGGDFGQALNIRRWLLEGATDSGNQAILQQRFDELSAQVETSFTDALSGGDFDLATSILGQIEASAGNEQLALGMRTMLEVAFQDALNTADFGTMRDIAGALADPAITGQLETQEQLFQGIAQGAIDSGNALRAADYATQIGDIGLLGQSLGALSGQLLGGAVQTAVSAQGTGAAGATPAGGLPAPAGAEGGTIFTKIDQGLSKTRATLETETPVIEAEMQQTGVVAGETGAAAEDGFGRAETAIIGLVATGVAQLPILIALAGELNTALEGAFQTASALGFQGIGADIPSRDAGGALAAGEAFRIRDELFISPFDAMALGTGSDSLLAGLQGGGGSSISNRNASINITINNMGAAQRAGSETSVSNLIRGYA